MKPFPFLSMLTAFLSIAISCDRSSLSSNVTIPGSVHMSIKMAGVGIIAKHTDSSFMNLCVRLSAATEPAIDDTIPIRGNGIITIEKTYNDLASQKTWTVAAHTLDSNDYVIHAGTTMFDVVAGQTSEITIDLSLQFSMQRHRR